MASARVDLTPAPSFRRNGFGTRLLDFVDVPWPLDEVEFSTAQFERTADDHIRN